jgi:hypothetical protein
VDGTRAFTRYMSEYVVYDLIEVGMSAAELLSYLDVLDFGPKSCSPMELG